MNKKIPTPLKNWLLYTLMWTVIFTILWPLVMLLFGFALQLFPSYASVGKSMLSLKTMVDALEQGALMGFFWGLFMFGFSLIPFLSKRDS